MIKVEANSLEEAYSKAAAELSCSVTELDLKVIQYPKIGFLGLGKKTAIVEAQRVSNGNKYGNNNSFHQKHDRDRDRNKHQQNRSHNNNQYNGKKQGHERFEKAEKAEFTAPVVETKKEYIPEPKKQEKVVAETPTAAIHLKETTHKERKHINTSTLFDDRFHKEKTDPNGVAGEIEDKIKLLFANLCFEIERINVSAYDEETLLIEIDGPDAALLIGKEGCRYKALSYLFYNWINIKYGLGIRLEIAEFLKNQEEMIGRYLIPIIERIKNQGRGQTKILDGVLIKIALERLRGEFPEKYVGIKNGREGGRFIVVNDFNRKNA